MLLVESSTFRWKHGLKVVTVLGAEMWSGSDLAQSPTSLKFKTSLQSRLQKAFITCDTLVNHMNAVTLS